MIVLGEILSNVQLDKFRPIAKIFEFFEFSGFYKVIVMFCDFSLLLSLYVFFSFSSDLNLQIN